MAITFTFYRVSERKPKHGESIIWLKESSSFGDRGFSPKEITVEYVWEEVDKAGALTGNGSCYSEDDNPADFVNHRIMILFDHTYAQDNDLWCPIDEFFDSFDNDTRDVTEESSDNLTIEKLAKEVEEQLFNKICYRYDSSVARCVGVAEDEYDFYYIMRKAFGELVYDSACVQPIPLDDNRSYSSIDDHFIMNDCPHEKELIIKVEV